MLPPLPPTTSSKKRVPLTEALAPPTKKARTVADGPPSSMARSRTGTGETDTKDGEEEEEEDEAQDPKLEVRG